VAQVPLSSKAKSSPSGFDLAGAAAALVPDSRVPTPGEELTVEETRKIARGYDLVIMHTSTPSFPTDAKFAELLREDNPAIRIGWLAPRRWSIRRLH